MRRFSLVVLTAALLLAQRTTLGAQDVPAATWSFRGLVCANGLIFDQTYSDTYGSGIGGVAGIGVRFRKLPSVEPNFETRFDAVTITRDPRSFLWMLRPEVGVRLKATFLRVFEPYLFGSAGYSFAGMSQAVSSTGGTASGLSWAGGGGFAINIGRYSIVGEIVYDQFVDLYRGLQLRLGGAWTLDRSLRLVPVSQAVQPELEPAPEPLQQISADGTGPTAVKAEDLDITFVDFDMRPVFPILYKYYDEHPIGSVVIANDTEVPLTDVEVRLNMQTYMDNPKLSASFSSLPPGARREVDLYALFNDQVLYMTEGDLISAIVSVEFKVDEVRGTDQETVTVEFYDRNALKWDDTQKVATFVTARDVEIQRWAKHLAALVRRDVNSEVSSNFQLGMMVYTAMVESELAYVIDPNSPYEQLSQDPHSVDFVQFPRQTFDFRAGDCDDLSVCYAALLEAAGVPTAFVTIPGHIFLAFKLEWDEAHARRRFNQADSLIFRDDGSVWVPVEVTLLDEDFITAWMTGAREWRESDHRGQTEFIPTSEAWKAYLPVAFGDDTTFERPDDEAVAEAFRAEVTRFVKREIADREALLLQRIDGSSGDPRRRNNLGALYARYGMYEEGREQFEAVLLEVEHAPTLVNLGNLAFLDEDLEAAFQYYERALRVNPGYPLALLGAARVSHELENYGTVSRLYDELKAANPALALQFEYLALRGEQASRASDATQLGGLVIWGDEE